MSRIKKRFAKIKITSEIFQYPIDNDPHTASESVRAEKPEKMTLVSDCVIMLRAGRFEIQYNESQLTGMEGSVTRLFFNTESPKLVTLLRSGNVSTALVFEEGVRHMCAYETPYFPIELCVDTLSLENDLSFEGGSFSAEYLVEMNGSIAEKAAVRIAIMQ